MKPYQFTFEAIGTSWSITIDDFNGASEEMIMSSIHTRIDLFDKTYSRFREDSLVTTMAHRPGDYILPEDAEPLFSLYKKLYTITEGIFTPLIGEVLSDAGYDASYSLTPRKLTSPASWEDTLSYSHPILTIKKPVLLDLGAGGKGYLVDILSTLLKENGIRDFCIDASGDMFYSSTTETEITVGLEHPENPKQVLGIAKIRNQSICGSAGNRRTWDKFHHIINPYTLESPKDIRAVWVIADTALLADSLATCLFFVSPENLLAHFDFTYVIVNNNYLVNASSDFNGELFIQRP